MITKKQADLVKLKLYKKNAQAISNLRYKQNEEVFAKYKEVKKKKKRQLRNKLVEMNMPLIVHFVTTWYKYSYEENAVFDVDDLIQEASLLLIETIEKYDPARGIFSSFLYSKLKGYLGIRNTIPNLPIHFGIGKVQRYKKVKRYMELGYEEQYISDKCNVSIKTIRLLRPFFEGKVSYEWLLENSDEDFLPYLKEQDYKEGDLYLARMMERPFIERRNTLLKEALDSLKERDKKLIIKKYGLDGKEPVELSQLKEEFGYKGSLIYERRKAAFKKLARYPGLKEAFLAVDDDYDYPVDEKIYSLTKEK